MIALRVRSTRLRYLVPLAAFVLVGTPAAAQTRLAVESTPANPRHDVLMRPVSVALREVPLKRAVDAVAASASIRIQYQGNTLDAITTPVTVSLSQVPLGVALDRVLSGTSLRVKVSATDALTLVEEPAAHSVEQGTIAGVVTDAKTKQPILTATVFVDGATRGITVNDGGTFQLSMSEGDHVIHVRAVGYTKVTRHVTATAGKTITLQVSMERSTSVLDEVVVTGTVTATERKTIPNPITVITAADIEQRGITRIEQLFRGEVPGVIAADRGSVAYGASLGAMASVDVYARGASNIPNSTTSNGTPTPLKTYIDGVEILDPMYLGTIDPKSIERVEIIVGPQAATVYGSGAMGGVMQIFTKKGAGSTALDLTLSLKYGMLENNIASSRTPMHQDGLSITGGLGPGFSYSGTMSYNYSGPWQPFQFSRSLGASVGATHSRGPVVVTGSVSMTSGKNGTTWGSGALIEAGKREGIWDNSFQYVPTRKLSTSGSQTLSLNLDYRALSFWQHHLTLGNSRTDFDLVPQGPQYESTADTLFRINNSRGLRTTYGYHTTLTSPEAMPLTSQLTLGFNGSSGNRTVILGCVPTASATTLTGCSGTANVSVTRPLDSDSWGGFGTLRVGLFDRLFLTFGLRGERNPQYGRAHKVDWTPNNGAALTLEHGAVTVKLLGSYGRATRPPTPGYRDQVLTYNPSFLPSQWASRLANPDLRPEYSRGPQGGIEIYYGNLGSFTVNYYRQSVTDLIANVAADTAYLTYIIDNSTVSQVQSMYVNIGAVKQQGWDATGSVNVGRLALKGTYSWVDNRILRSAYPASFPIGQSFTGVPAHTGNITASYAHGATSVTLVSNIMGEVLTGEISGPHTIDVYWAGVSYRLKEYAPRRNTVRMRYSQAGYVKSDLAISQRMSSWASVTMNVMNLTDSYEMEGDVRNPTLGRKTLLGLSLRYPVRR